MLKNMYLKKVISARSMFLDNVLGKKDIPEKGIKDRLSKFINGKAKTKPSLNESLLSEEEKFDYQKCCFTKIGDKQINIDSLNEIDSKLFKKWAKSLDLNLLNDVMKESSFRVVSKTGNSSIWKFEDSSGQVVNYCNIKKILTTKTRWIQGGVIFDRRETSADINNGIILIHGIKVNSNGNFELGKWVDFGGKYGHIFTEGKGRDSHGPYEVNIDRISYQKSLDRDEGVRVYSRCIGEGYLEKYVLSKDGDIRKKDTCIYVNDSKSNGTNYSKFEGTVEWDLKNKRYNYLEGALISDRGPRQTGRFSGRTLVEGTYTPSSYNFSWHEFRTEGKYKLVNSKLTLISGKVFRSCGEGREKLDKEGDFIFLNKNNCFQVKKGKIHKTDGSILEGVFDPSGTETLIDGTISHPTENFEIIKKGVRYSIEIVRSKDSLLSREKVKGKATYADGTVHIGQFEVIDGDEMIRFKEGQIFKNGILSKTGEFQYVEETGVLALVKGEWIRRNGDVMNGEFEYCASIKREVLKKGTLGVPTSDYFPEDFKYIQKPSDRSGNEEYAVGRLSSANFTFGSEINELADSLEKGA